MYEDIWNLMDIQEDKQSFVFQKIVEAYEHDMVTKTGFQPSPLQGASGLKPSGAERVGDLINAESLPQRPGKLQKHKSDYL